MIRYLYCRPTAIHWKLGAGDIICSIAAQKHNCLSDLSRCRKLLVWMLLSTSSTWWTSMKLHLMLSVGEMPFQHHPKNHFYTSVERSIRVPSLHRYFFQIQPRVLQFASAPKASEPIQDKYNLMWHPEPFQQLLKLKLSTYLPTHVLLQHTPLCSVMLLYRVLKQCESTDLLEFVGPTILLNDGITHCLNLKRWSY